MIKIPNNLLATTGGCDDAQPIFKRWQPWPVWCGLSQRAVGISCPSYVPSKLLVSPQTCGAVWEAGKALALCEHGSARIKIFLSYPAFSTHPKHSSVVATMEEKNSIPVKTSTRNKPVNFATEKERSGKQLPSLG